MSTRQHFGATGFLLLVGLLVVGVCDVAGAQTRWPPWQSYGEAEKAARAKQKRHAVPKQSEIDALNARVATLRQAGKTDEAIAVAKRALSLTERRHGRNGGATAQALTTLAELLIEKKRYADAEPLLKRAVAIREKAGPDSPELGDALYALASLYKKQGRTAEAESLLKRSAALSDRPGPGRKPAIVAASPPKAESKPEGGNGMGAAQEKTEAYAKDKEAADRAKAEETKQSAEAARRRALEQLEAERHRLQQESEARTAAKEDAAPPTANAPAPSDGMFKKFSKPRARAYRRAAPPGAAAPSAPMTTERGVLDEKSGGGAAPEEKMAAPSGGASSGGGARATGRNEPSAGGLAGCGPVGSAGCRRAE